MRGLTQAVRVKVNTCPMGEIIFAGVYQGGRYNDAHAITRMRVGG